MKHKSRDFYKKLILLTISILITLLFVEAGFRLIYWLKYNTTKAYVGSKFHIDSKSGLRVPVSGTSAGSITISSQGFRSPELDNQKPARIRLAFLGASTTFCSEVSSNENTWPHIVWKNLQDSYHNIDMDYVNPAVPGYTVSNSLRNLQYRVQPLKPDVIVIYHAHNDLAKNSMKLAKQKNIYNDSFHRKSWLETKSLAWDYLNTNRKIITVKHKAKKKQARLIFDPKILSQNFRKQLETLIIACKEVAPVVAIATFSHKIRYGQPKDEQLNAATIALHNMPYMSVSGLLKGYEEYNRVIRDVANKTGILLIDGQNKIPADDKHFNDTIHFNDSGSKEMAKIVINSIIHSEEFINLLNTHTVKHIP